MNSIEKPHRARLPDIVRIVICNAVRLRHEGGLTDDAFQARINRLRSEEIEPRGFELCVRELPDQHTRFIIKSPREGRVLDMIDCAPDGSINTGNGAG